MAWIRFAAVIAIAAFFCAAAMALTDRQRDLLIEDLCLVESGGDAIAVGDGGSALGILQIQPVMVSEANRVSGRHYMHQDALDPVLAREIARVVLKYYDTFIQKQTGRTATRRELAYVWNGGGSAWVRAVNPKNDVKQRRLERYYSKLISISEEL